MAFKKTNIEEQLFMLKKKRASEAALLKEINTILNHTTPLERIITPHKTNAINNFDFDRLDTNRIYHINEIKDTCITFRLRFLEAALFKGTFPSEAVDAVHQLENAHKTKLKNLYLMAPSKYFKLESADDPLLFAPIGNGYFYLIHKWGKDLNPFRKLLMLPFKNFLNLIMFLVFISFLTTKMLPLYMFTNKPEPYQFWIIFLFMIKGVIGLSLYFGFSQGKNVSSAVWNSNYYNA